MDPWNEQQYKIAQQFLETPSENISDHPLQDCGEGIWVIRPTGLPALGVKFHGAFMLAPLPVFMLIVLSFPILGFTSMWTINLTSILITFACIGLFLGLYRAMGLLLKQREIFPERYFVTLGPEGVAMHFSRFHFPFREPTTQLEWPQVASIESTRILFFPALLLGRFKVSALELKSNSGDSVLIPFRSQDMDAVQKHIESYLKPS